MSGPNMNEPTKIAYFKNRGQGMVLVMQALDELGGSNTKQDVIDYINRSGYYDVTKHDLPPYKNQNEPKYHTLLAWARKDCVLRDAILNNERDAWALSRIGRSKLENIRRRFANGEWDVRRCYLWTPIFKKKFFPAYVPSEDDAKRPEDVWEELLAIL